MIIEVEHMQPSITVKAVTRIAVQGKILIYQTIAMSITECEKMNPQRFCKCNCILFLGELLYNDYFYNTPL